MKQMAHHQMDVTVRGGFEVSTQGEDSYGFAPT